MTFSRRSLVILLGAGVLLVVPLLATLFNQPFWITLATRIVIYGLAALSLDLALGVAGLVSFGHAAFFALGGYVVAIAASNGAQSALFVWPLAMLAAALLGLLVGALSLRTSGVFFIMITLAFAQMLFYLLIALKVFGGYDGLALPARSTLPLLPLHDPTAFYFTALGALFVCGALAWRIAHSPFGMALRAGKASERKVAALGFPMYRYRLIVFVISAAGTGLAGALWADFARFVSPDMASWSRSGELLSMVILGGIGSLVGPVFGAAALVALESGLSGISEHWMVILGPLIVIVVLFAKRGLFGWLGGADE